MRKIAFIVVLAGLSGVASAASLGSTLFGRAKAAPKGPQEVVLRHALGGEAAAALVELAERFNAESKTDKVVLQHLSMVTDVHQLPHLALLDDDEMQRFFGGRPRTLALHKVLADGGEKIDPSRLLPVMLDVADDGRGRLRMLPLAYSVPVLFFNRDAFRKARLDPARPPATWWELQTTAGKLLEAGYACPYTTSNPAWVQLENLATQHSEPLANAERGGKARLALNGMVQVKHIALLSSWYKSSYFHYFGPGREADDKFASGACGMLTSDSALYARLGRVGVGFDVGVAELPHYDDVYGAAPGRVLPDGQALWALAGKKSAEYKPVARFVAFLLKPDSQKAWVAATGYLPLVPGVVDAARPDYPEALRKVVRQLGERRMVTAARPKMFTGFDRVRAILNEELEAVWANRKPAKEALDTAVLRGNAALQPAPPDAK